MDDSSPAFLSFADALTCVFGAAIALFLIFVTLVKVAPPTRGEKGGAVTERIDRVVGVATGAGASDAVLRVFSADCGALQELRLSGLPHEAWGIGRSDRNGSTCESLFRIDRTAVFGGQGELYLTERWTAAPLFVVLAVGGDQPMTWRIPGCPRLGRIATLAIGRRPPLVVEGCGS